MKYTEYVFKNSDFFSIKTEALFEIATRRVQEFELIRFSLFSQEKATVLKRKNAMKRFLKGLKENGTIQFFAFCEAFEENSTEAKYLQNKYPDIFLDTPTETELCFFVYVRI